ncbi:MAG: hypothetical protein AMXMBFR13_34040 [Phycisphaerae bacterium]
MATRTGPVGVSAALLSLTLIMGAGCPQPGPELPDTCAAQVAEADVNVAGIYRYGGDSPRLLTGTITFEQEGDVVRVLDTTYDLTADRRLEGTAVLRGNRLTIQLVPRNGDEDYTADVTFLFSDDGTEFCVEFSDTNGDAGPMGTYKGVRIAREG